MVCVRDLSKKGEVNVDLIVKKLRKDPVSLQS